MGVAALMAAIFLYESIGLASAGLLLAGFAVGTVAWRLYRTRDAGEGPDCAMPGLRRDAGVDGAGMQMLRQRALDGQLTGRFQTRASATRSAA